MLGRNTADKPQTADSYTEGMVRMKVPSLDLLASVGALAAFHKEKA